VGALAQHCVGKEQRAGGLAMSRLKRKSRLPPFVPLLKRTSNSEAWRAMSYGARLLYIELRGYLRNDGLNNGKVFRSCRDAAKALGTQSTRSIVRWYAELEYYGFIRKTADGFLGADGEGIAATYRFTDVAHGTHPPTYDFEQWDGVMFEYTPRRPRRKKQNPVPLGDTPRVPEGHIRKAPGPAPVCVPRGHTHSHRECVPEGHTSRLPLRSAALVPPEGNRADREVPDEERKTSGVR